MYLRPRFPVIAALGVALLAASAARASVAIDNTGTELTTGGSATSASYTGLTVSAGLPNGALLMEMTCDSNISGVSAVWDSGGTNQSMTLIKDQAGQFNEHVILWGLVAPTAGNKTLAVAWTTAAQCFIEAVSLKGANQTGGTGTFANVTGNFLTSGASMSLNVTSKSGDLVFAGWMEDVQGTMSSVNQTQLYLVNTGINVAAAENWAPGAATVTMTANATVSNGAFAGAAVDVVAAPSGLLGGPF